MSAPDRQVADLTVARAVGVSALAGIALIHVLDLPGKITEVPYLGVGYLALIAASVAVAGQLLARDSRRSWLLTGLLAATTALGYVADRTVGLPMANRDIGNWLEPLGMASLFIEVALVFLAAWAVHQHRPEQTAGHSTEPAAQRLQRSDAVAR